MKYSKELHERVRQNLRMFDYPRFDDGDIDCLLDEIERLQAERRWTPVSERLPEKPVTVLAISEQKVKFFGSYVNGWWDMNPLYLAPTCKIITHWMPLPEPPSEEEC